MCNIFTLIKLKTISNLLIHNSANSKSFVINLGVSNKTPSYKGLKPASELASRVKRNNRRVNTKPEMMLRSELWKKGLRYRVNVKNLPGKPDIVFSKSRIAIFCDGDFWHGRNWLILKKKLETGNNATYWIAKISTNMKRDKRNTILLEEMGWRVIRIWEKDIKQNVSEAANKIEMLIKQENSALPG